MKKLTPARPYGTLPHDRDALLSLREKLYREIDVIDKKKERLWVQETDLHTAIININQKLGEMPEISEIPKVRPVEKK